MDSLFLRCGLLCVILLTTSLASADPSISATLEPQQVSVGEQAQLTVSVSGSNTAPSLPDVPGLEISHVGQSTQIQIINGAMSASATHTYIIIPQREGTFTIPPIQAGSAQTQPLILKVLKATGSSSPGASGLPAPNVGAPNVGGTRPADAKYGFVQLQVPKKEVYVGELIPVEVRACVNSGVQATINALPSLNSEAFAMNPLGNKPHRTGEVIEGRQYTVLAWRSAMTAVKAGDFPPKMEMPVTVIVRTARQSGSPLDDIFNQLGRGGQPLEVTLDSDPEVITVLPLPLAHRPASFSGAVGTFEFTAAVTPASVAVGDPVTLRMTVTGSGNFDRVSSEMLPSTSAWKTYPPKSTFEPADSASYSGTKTFEQVIMPNEAGSLQTPPLAFAFFDPEKKQYRTWTAPALSVQVTGAPATTTGPALGSAPGSAPTPAQAPAKPADDLVPNKIETGAFTATLRPLFLSPWYLCAQSLPLLLLMGGLAWLGRQRRLASDPRFARSVAAQQAITAQLHAMDAAMRGHHAEAFFTAARRALQQRLGERWSMNPDAVTLAEVSTRMNGEGEPLRPLFEMADHVTYSGQSLNDADFRHWKDFVTTQLTRLKTP